MKQVKFRSVLLLLLIVLLGLGLALFCLRYTFRGEAWASFSANGHAYTDGVVRTGQVLDRNGTVLYDGPSGVYHEDSALRQATLHAVGDQLGTSPPRRWRRSSPGSSALTPHRHPLRRSQGVSHHRCRPQPNGVEALTAARGWPPCTTIRPAISSAWSPTPPSTPPTRRRSATTTATMRVCI
ncbi:MAG: hypothetical protein ACLUIX_08720 [Oscillospiraceae bacterium]